MLNQSRNPQHCSDSCRKRSSGRNDFTPSVNKTHSEVKLEQEGREGVYEDPEKLASTGLGQGNYELTQCPAYESTTCKQQPHPTESDDKGHYEA